MRRRHRRALLRDADALHALAVALVALVGSGGLMYLGYAWHVLQVARRAPARPALERVDAVLLFGKHSPDGDPDADFRARIERARALARLRPGMPMLLLGGGPAPTEAEVAARELRAGDLPAECELVLEDQSRDTLENLRHARALLHSRRADTVLLLSSRYHLARCALFARQLRIPHRLCAAENEFSIAEAGWRRLLMEAGLTMWVDLGLRWARLIGHRRMLSKFA